MVTSKRHPFKFYFIVVFLIVFVSTIGIVPIVVIIDKWFNQGAFYFEGIIAIPFVIAIIFLGIWAIVMFSVNSPRIIIDATTISFYYQTTKEVYNISDIDTISYTGKRTMQYGLGNQAEGAMITFKNGEIKHIYDDMYSNTSELKQYLQQLTEGNTYISQHAGEDTDIGAMKYYKGVLIFSIRGQFSLFLMSMPLYALFKGVPNIGLVLVMLAIFAGIFSLFSSTFYYIGISDKYLSIKNHLQFWKRAMYRLEDIEEVVFDTATRSPNHIRVITKDFRNKMYAACTLSDKKWKELEQDLLAKGIKVRNHLNLWL